MCLLMMLKYMVSLNILYWYIYKCINVFLEIKQVIHQNSLNSMFSQFSFLFLVREIPGAH